LNCYDAPVLFYFKGETDLNAARILSVVGTRNPSIYGRQQCEAIISGLPKDVLLISGLASGIDTFAHRSALNNGQNTIGILAHGLDTIYPRHNVNLARQMTRSGGLITEFMSGIQPDRENFPSRNRIVAGMSDATLVMETGAKGGSMITARLANEYNREVFAFPGRSIDPKSEGCNLLIKNNRAQLITSVNDLLEFMNWNDLFPKPKPIQFQLFAELNETEKQLAGILQQSEKNIDDLLMCGIPAGKLASTLLNLELNGLVETLPGKRYRWKG
ncbi:MAG: DNA-protecting protein DprA, partial [Chitinophagaceae bacterium]